MAAGVRRRGVIALMAGLVLAACASAPAAGPKPNADTEAAVLTLYLVRHAEKAAGEDPPLTEAGAARAAALAARLKDTGLTEIWSTRTARTQQTAVPVAAATGLPIQIYDAATLPAFASWLRETPGVKLVVGHSNTTNELAALLGAEPGPPFDEAAEFDRLYVIRIDANGNVRSRIERYGAAG